MRNRGCKFEEVGMKKIKQKKTKRGQIRFDPCTGPNKGSTGLDLDFKNSEPALTGSVPGHKSGT